MIVDPRIDLILTRITQFSLILIMIIGTIFGSLVGLSIDQIIILIVVLSLPIQITWLSVILLTDLV